MTSRRLLQVTRCLAVFAAISWTVVATAHAADSIRSSVVRITVTQRPPNFVQPWTKGQQRDASGTGFVIDGNRILTNAHVVQYASQIYVQGNESADKHAASLIVIAPAIDLAMIAVDDKSFFEGRPALPLSEGYPEPKSAVNVYGYPIGGEQLSVTEGIVSRVEFAGYNYGGMGLRVQVDAALNPGNSGGPAISSGKVVGAVFSGIRMADNIGYLIPVDEINMFLADVADGTYRGKPFLRDEFQTVENDAVRARLKLPKGTGGLMVTRPAKSDADYPLKEWDVMTHIADQPIDNAGKVKVGGELQLPFQYLFPKMAHDGKITVTIFRDGKTHKADLTLERGDNLAVPYLYNNYPRYFIFGPMVFSPASREFVSLLGLPAQGVLRERNSPLVGRLVDKAAFDGEEIVVVPSPFFTHRIVKGYSQPMAGVISHVNNTAVKNLAHVKQLLEGSKDEFIEFRFAGKGYETLVFRRTELAASTEEVLTDYSIRKQASDDLLAPAGR